MMIWITLPFRSDDTERILAVVQESAIHEK